MMKIAYIAGPYRAKTKLGIVLNIIRARKVAKKYWKKGYAVICPHSNSALFDGVVPDETFLDGDIEILNRCDVIVAIEGWQRSEGTKNELRFARTNNIPIIYDGE
ncbi:MAG TPA: DUF4406 domain-containing protein [Pseudobacteroides sp.]|uniref:DUF4406 domain-containing protein n=1 Tax=Pseudobacteroides sp. TaxID=1968840 RepID=UPI002F94E7B9